LDPNACTFAYPGCDPYSCSSEECLDDAGTRAQAAAAFARGIKVYLVGFGADAVANRAIFDGIAQSGGTGHAYIASDAAALSTTVNSLLSTLAAGCP
jgi:hypothetical protein